jgi:predicted negative regulator of RcsB-dependent stress response
MAKRPTGSRRRPEPPQHDDDVFVAKVFEASTWAQKHSQLLILGIVVVVLGVVFSRYYVNRREARIVSGVQDLEAIQQVLVAGDAETGQVRLAQFIERYDGSSLEAEARLVLARLHLDRGEAGQALDALDDGSLELSTPLGPQAAMLMARAHEAQGDPDAAEALYLRVAERSELEFQVVNAYEDAARLRLLTGDAAGAVELYERLLERLEPTAPQRSQVEMRLAEARTRARTASSPGG